MTPRLEKIRDELASDRQFPSDCVEFSFGFTAACDILLPLIAECKEAMEMGAFHHNNCSWLNGGSCCCSNWKVPEALLRLKQTLEGSDGNENTAQASHSKTGTRWTEKPEG